MCYIVFVICYISTYLNYLFIDVMLGKVVQYAPPSSEGMFIYLIYYDISIHYIHMCRSFSCILTILVPYNTYTTTINIINNLRSFRPALSCSLGRW